MRLRTLFPISWVLTLLAATAQQGQPGGSQAEIQLRDGRPIVDGVYVNGRGPFRFLLDTGSNVNQIESRLAHKIGLIATSHVQLASPAGTTTVGQSDGNQITLDTATASGQRLLISPLDAIHSSSPDVQGVLGTWFLMQFDFAFDFQLHTLTFTALPASGDLEGLRVGFHLVNMRPVVSTSLGNLELDSGTNQVVLFGVRFDDMETGYQFRTIAGSRIVGKSYDRQLMIGGKRLWKGDAVAIPARPEAGVDGLLPINLFKTLYICNSGGYIIFR